MTYGLLALMLRRASISTVALSSFTLWLHRLSLSSGSQVLMTRYALILKREGRVKDWSCSISPTARAARERILLLQEGLILLLLILIKSLIIIRSDWVYAWIIWWSDGVLLDEVQSGVSYVHLLAHLIVNHNLWPSSYPAPRISKHTSHMVCSLRDETRDIGGWFSLL